MFTVVFNIFLTPGERELFRWKFIRITDTGLKTAFLMGLRLVVRKILNTTVNINRKRTGFSPRNINRNGTFDIFIIVNSTVAAKAYPSMLRTK